MSGKEALIREISREYLVQNVTTNTERIDEIWGMLATESGVRDVRSWLERTVPSQSAVRDLQFLEFSASDIIIGLVTSIVAGVIMMLIERGMTANKVRREVEQEVARALKECNVPTLVDMTVIQEVISFSINAYTTRDNKTI